MVTGQNLRFIDKKFGSLRLGVANNMRPLSWAGTNGKDPKMLTEC